MKSFPKNSVFVRAVEKFGHSAQKSQTIEELNELAVAISHEKRNDRPESLEERKNKVLSELADVAIMIEQMKYIYGIDEFEKAYAAKMARLEDKLKQEAIE